MMRYMYGSWGLMSGFGFFGLLIGLVVLVDLILIGLWLWKQINK